VSRLPFADATFDALYCLDGFGSDFPSLAAEALRVLRPGNSFALLLNLPSTRIGEALSRLCDASASDVYVDYRTDSAAALTERWLDAYERHSRAHAREVGKDTHRLLVDGLRSLLDGYRAQAIQRVLLAGRRAD
jgi:SAM-dependent methyltransferase